MTVDYQPWAQGCTYPAWDIPLLAGGVADNITNVNISAFTMIFRNTSVAPPVDTTGTGTFSVKTLSPAEVYYKPSIADVANAFNGVLIVTAGFPPSNSAADLAKWDPITFVITAE